MAALKNALIKFAPIFFLAILTLVLFSPFLFGGKMPPGQEDMGQYYPALFFYQQAIQKGGSLLWDNSYYGGFPSFLNGFGGFFYPLHYVLFKFLPFFTAYHVAMVLPVFGGMVFSYLFGRANSFSRVGALILALGYTTGYTFGALDTGLSYANGFLVLPLLLFSVFKAHRASDMRHAIPPMALGMVGAAVGFLAGFPQTVLYGIAFSFLYAGYLDINSWGIIWRSFRATGALVCMVLVGAFMASPQLAATADYLDVSIRTGTYTAQVSEYLPWGEWILFLLPPIFDIPRVVVSIPGIYIGALPLFFALFAIVVARGSMVRLFFISYLVMAAMAFDLAPFSWFNKYFPLFSRISNPARWLYIGSFLLSFLGAYGYERLRTHGADFIAQRRYALVMKMLGTLSCAGAIGATAFSAFLSYLSTNPRLKEMILQWAVGEHAGMVHYQSVFAIVLTKIASVFSLTNGWFLLAVVLLPLSFFLVRWCGEAHRRRWCGALVLAVVTLNTSLVFAPFFHELIPQSIFFEEPAAVRAIKARGQDLNSFRILSLLPGEGIFRGAASHKKLSTREGAVLNREALANQIQGVHGLDTIGGYEPLRTLRQNQLIDTVVAPNELTVFDEEAAKRGAPLDQKVNRRAVRTVSLEEKLADVGDKLGLLSMMNVKYILSPYTLAHADLDEIALSPPPKIPLALHLYENVRMLPRIYFAAHPILWRGTERDLLIAVAQTPDFSAKTFIECQRCPMSAKSLGRHAVTVEEYRSGEAQFMAESENGGWLIFGESRIPGWVATIDGERASIYPANYLFQAIFVPAGMHEIKFEYRGTFRLRLDPVLQL